MSSVFAVAEAPPLEVVKTVGPGGGLERPCPVSEEARWNLPGGSARLAGDVLFAVGTRTGETFWLPTVKLCCVHGEVVVGGADAAEPSPGGSGAGVWSPGALQRRLGVVCP